jgi:hypothetical protein
MNTQYQVGQQVQITVPDYGTMVGTIDRVVKMSAPCVPTEDPALFTYHVTVPGSHPRMSGTFCLNASRIDHEA